MQQGQEKISKTNKTQINPKQKKKIETKAVSTNKKTKETNKQNPSKIENNVGRKELLPLVVECLGKRVK